MTVHRHGEVVHTHDFTDPDHSHAEESKVSDERPDPGDRAAATAPVDRDDRPHPMTVDRDARTDDDTVAVDRDEHEAEPRTITVPAPGAYEVRPDTPGLIGRIALTALGATGLVVGALLEWLSADELAGGGAAGTDISYRIFYTTDVELGRASFLTSAGAVTIVLGLLALVGLASRTGWITRLAGALGIVAFALYAITLFRAPGVDVIRSIGIGAWLVLLGGLLTLVAGFMGSARKVVVPPDEQAVVQPG